MFVQWMQWLDAQEDSEYFIWICVRRHDFVADRDYVCVTVSGVHLQTERRETYMVPVWSHKYWIGRLSPKSVKSIYTDSLWKPGTDHSDETDYDSVLLKEKGDLYAALELPRIKSNNNIVCRINNNLSDSDLEIIGDVCQSESQTKPKKRTQIYFSLVLALSRMQAPRKKSRASRMRFF